MLKLKKKCELYHKKEKNSLRSGKKFYFNIFVENERSVTTTSTRLFLAILERVLFGAIGLNSPCPVACNLDGSILTIEIKNFTTEVALAEDNSQLDGNCLDRMGVLSVCPSTSIDLGFFSRSLIPTDLRISKASGLSLALPFLNNTSSENLMTAPCFGLLNGYLINHI